MNTLDTKLNLLINTPSDINEHLQAIKDIASECDYIIELGVRVPISTFALLAGRPKSLLSVDILHPSYFNGVAELELAYKLAQEENIDFSFILHDSVTLEYKQCDLLFIDTWHCYKQLISELISHQEKVSKYIILHDTTTYAYEDEADWAKGPVPNYIGELKQGLWPAVEDFLESYDQWSLFKRYTHNNGLTILKRND